MICHKQLIIKKSIGSGTYSKLTFLFLGEIFHAYDTFTNKNVALKIEKVNISKNILIQEFLAISCLQNNTNPERQKVPKIYQFYQNLNKNFFAMELLGQNILTYMTSFPETNTIYMINEMLNCIEEVHSKGIVHLDIKPSNFVVSNNPLNLSVYIIDFGLSQPYINTNGDIVENQNIDFIGTIKYASLNSHNVSFLSRRDDLWSFYFILLEFLKISLPWNKINKSFKDKKELIVIIIVLIIESR